LQLNLDEKSLLNNMSKNVIFVGHPNLKASKLNKSLLLEVEKHPEILVRDVYKLYGDLTFNGHINPEEDQKIIEGAERIILQFPFHWYTAPALLKQWFDDVFAYNWAFGTDNPKTAGKKLLVAITTGGRLEDYQPNGYNNYFTTEFLNQFIQSAKLCKMEFAGAFFVQGARVITSEEIAIKAKEYIRFIKG
jgi:glutathione-regulated potassium-efflux system ancillary protein KefG